ncbi:MAG: LemA family protein [Sodalinema sp.]|uniref:LemA family protein n=1 Tax=Sodalinema sp. TaxID=3080550 RepID=UPI001207BF60|nr:MAG: LemA family protein [Phormidium sp. SL48-SHIP]
MENNSPKIPDELAPEVLEIASRYYSESQNSYSLAELKDAGAEVQIPPELIEKALEEVRVKKEQEQQQQEKAQERRKTAQWIAAGVAIIVSLWGIAAYNGLANRAQEVQARWAQVENQLQRRADLIPNLVSVARSQAASEQEVIEQLERSRQAYLQASRIDEKQAAIAEVEAAIEQFQDAMANNSNLSNLENSQAFQNLSYEIAGTENRIAVERRRYNEAVQAYNSQLRQFPQALIGNIAGFETQPYFESQTPESPQPEP